MQANAAALEMALRQLASAEPPAAGQASPEFEALIAAIESGLLAFTAAVQEQLGETAVEAAAETASAASPEAIRQAFAQLEALLATQDMEATIFARQAMPLLRTALGERTAVLQRQLAAIDFSAALATLRAVRGKTA